MASMNHLECPKCDGESEEGFLGYYTGLFWHKEKLRGLKNLFLYTVGEGDQLTGSVLSSGLLRMIPAYRCENCRAVLFLPEVKEEQAQA